MVALSTTIFDARGATTNVTAEQVRMLVQRAADTLRRIPVGPTAIVATDDVVFGMPRMYAILTEEAELSARTFCTFPREFSSFQTAKAATGERR